MGGGGGGANTGLLVSGAIAKTPKFDPTAHGVIRIMAEEPPQTIRERIGRMILGKNYMHESMAARGKEMDVMKITSLPLPMDGVPSRSIRLIKAENGTIIGYEPELDMNVLGSRSREKFYLVKEGDSVLEAIATCLALDKLK